MKRILLKRITLLMFFVIIGSFINAQSKQDSVPPLFRFFQHNFDTTIISASSSNWVSTELPRYDIVAIKDGKPYFLTYKNPYPFTYFTNWPKSLSAMFSRENLAYTSLLPDTNRYLFPVELSYKQSVAQIKKSLDSLSIWTIRDDKADGADWPECKAFISDAGSDNFYLITSSTIKKLSFYASDYYEKECKPRDGRHRIIQVIHIFNEVFPQ